MSAMPKRKLTGEELADAERLRATWDKLKPTLKLSQEQVAFQCGWKTQGAFSQYLLGTIPLNLEALLRIAGVLKADPNEISPRLMKTVRDSEAHNKSRLRFSLAKAPAGIPIVGNTQGGPDKAWVETGHPVGYGDEYVDMISRDSHAYALYVRGSSMAPRFREGDVIIVEPSMPAQADDDVVVRTTDGQVMIKTLVSNRNDQITLASIAEGHDRIVLRLSQVEFIHPVGATVPPRSVLKRKAV